MSGGAGVPAATPYDDKNVFSQIIRGEMPAHKIFETPHCIAILDAFPVASGHALLIPKSPVTAITDCPENVARDLFEQLPRLSRMVKHSSGAEGVNIVTNDGSSAGQVVMHLHIHVIPRKWNDNLAYRFPPSASNMVSNDDAHQIISKMQKYDSS